MPILSFLKSPNQLLCVSIYEKNTRFGHGDLFSRLSLKRHLPLWAPLSLISRRPRKGTEDHAIKKYLDLWVPPWLTGFRCRCRSSEVIVTGLKRDPHDQHHRSLISNLKYYRYVIIRQFEGHILEFWAISITLPGVYAQYIPDLCVNRTGSVWRFMDMAMKRGQK